MPAVRRTLGCGGVAALVLAAVVGCGSDADDYRAAPEPTTVSTTADAESDSPSTSVVYLPPPYIDHTEWVETAVGPSLQVYPTPNGRRVTTADAQGKAWREVVKRSSGYGQYSARTPGMRAQFDCHWIWARAVQPDKSSWNLEPTRPVVSEDQMVATRCNPGFAEEY
ncbi:MAG: DUF2599 domain-containing protein [Gordonia sp. (in: high G+C Gram-positive bacteria)]|uniref:DUF2599 domain-containing protein n=1 Tax=Gordonia sp. (in: high G+C Gram-positive bacteria) TaxID=84139 RepID=UPI0039E67186